MASDPVTYRGIVIASVPYKEKDSMLSVLTRDDGMVKICAKGTQKPGSRNSAASVPFAVLDIVCTVSHGFNYLKEVSVVESNSGILSSLDAMAVAGHISRVLNFSVFQSEISAEAYELTAYALYAMSAGFASARAVFAAFNWRYLSIAGLTGPDDRTVLCSFSVRSVLDTYVTCDMKKLFVLKISPDLVDELYDLTLSVLSERFEYQFPDPCRFVM